MERFLPRHVSSRTAVATLAVCAGVVSVLAGCSDDKSPVQNPPPVTPTAPRIVVVTSDFATGAISVADTDTAVTLHNDLQSIHPDAVARTHGSLLYVINRAGADNVQVLDSANNFQTVRQFSTGTGSNPHDIAFTTDNRAYVSCNGSPFLLEVNPGTGAILDSVSLAQLADRDGNPDMDRLFYREPYLYVSIQRIDYADSTYAPVPPSYLAIVDTRTNVLADSIVLAGLNPCAPMVWDSLSSSLLVPESGRYGVADAGIEKVDLAGWHPAGWLATEVDLGGDLVDFALATGGGPGYATVAEPGFTTSAVQFDRATGARTAIVYHSNSYDLADLIIVPEQGYLLVCDRNYQSPGLRVYYASNGQPVAFLRQPIPTGLPPFELVYLR
jgi:hypothetical protein